MHGRDQKLNNNVQSKYVHMANTETTTEKRNTVHRQRAKITVTVTLTLANNVDKPGT